MARVDMTLGNNKIIGLLGSVTSPIVVLSELIKNAIDANAKNIIVNVWEEEKKIIIEDDGQGFTLEEIKQLGEANKSGKKILGNLTRNDGSFFAGSKGLGILSIFSISDECIIETQNKNERYIIEWKKFNQGFDYSRIDTIKNGISTKITIQGIKDNYLKIVTDAEEIQKLKHISIKNYIRSTLDTKNIKFFINGQECRQLYINPLPLFENEFDIIIEFKYIKSENKLIYRQKINNSKEVYRKSKINFEVLNHDMFKGKNLEIDLNKDINTFKIMKDNYGVTKATVKSKQIKYMDMQLESFEGKILLKSDRKSQNIIDLGYGVKIFINQFAIYGYLEEDKDWLNFATISQTKKATTYKPHNVYGYIHFDNFDENTAALQISNERAYFKEEGSFKKFQQIIKEIVINLSINIDIGIRNNLIDECLILTDLYQNSINASKFEDNKNTHDENNSKTEDNEVSKNKLKDEVVKEPKNKFQDENLEIPQNEPKNEGEGVSKDRTKHENVQVDKKGTTNQKNEDIEDNSSQYKTINFKPKPNDRLFTRSDVLKNSEQIHLEYNELIGELKTLGYERYHLVYAVSFRAILEDITKRYLVKRNIPLDGDLGKNVFGMTNDMLTIIKNQRLIDTSVKKRIEDAFGGFNAMKGFLDRTGSSFHTNVGQGWIMKILNLNAHTPVYINRNEAEAIANNIIVPLMFLKQEIFESIKSNK